jgi:predicted HTH transcriptional regulator
VPESSQVHRYKNKIYDRVGDADIDISNNHSLINNIYLRKNKEFTENEVLPFLEISDLDADTFKKARRLASVWDDNHPWLMMDDAEILKSSGLWRKDTQTGKEGYILAAALLFGKDNTVLSCCPAYKTDAIYRNMSYERFLHPLPTDPDVRYDDRDDIRVNLIEAYQRLMNFVNRNLPDKFHIEGIQRMDIRDKIFREIAANCLIHREYSHSFPAKFLIFSDRVITENWNKPAGDNPITIEQLETHTKNPMIARIFKELGWVEELGSGRKNVQKYAPLYYSDYEIGISNEDKFVFSITYRDADENVNDKVNRLEATDNQTNKIQRLIDELINDNVNDENRLVKRPVNDEKRIVNDEKRVVNDEKRLVNRKISVVKKELNNITLIIADNPGINQKKLAELLNKGNTVVHFYIKLLKDANIIEFIGSAKTEGYYLTEMAKNAISL